MEKIGRDGWTNGFFGALAPWWQDNKNLDNLECIGKYLYGLKELPEVEFHGMQPSEVKCIENFDKIADRVVLVNQFSNSCTLTELQLEYFGKIIDFLSKRGYILYSNVVEEQLPMPGCKPLRCSLGELLGIAYKIPLILSVRSGILDFLVKTDVDMFVLSSRNSLRCPLKEWGRKGRICEFYNNETDNDTDLQLFKNFFDKITSEKKA